MTDQKDITLQVGVKAFLKNKKGKFLLLRRSEKYKDIKGNWDIVGGRINPGSSLSDNLKREILEETGLVLHETPEILTAQDILRVHGKHIVRITYLANIEGNPKIDAESTDFKWMTIAEMKAEKELDMFVREILDQGLLN
ncbi:MAG: NUDIX hydrolase [Candidatus Pacebacteria bacterium]|nr:NUDIX hydrolase [Candidatus Paceibacterota bacterium]MDD5356799.1 NUDIX hydrolase [Candidatus Paceibacterota bacterium]